jgi:hypothetical protein
VNISELKVIFVQVNLSNWICLDFSTLCFISFEVSEFSYFSFMENASVLTFGTSIKISTLSISGQESLEE